MVYSVVGLEKFSIPLVFFDSKKESSLGLPVFDLSSLASSFEGINLLLPHQDPLLSLMQSVQKIEFDSFSFYVLGYMRYGKTFAYRPCSCLLTNKSSFKMTFSLDDAKLGFTTTISLLDLLFLMKNATPFDISKIKPAIQVSYLETEEGVAFVSKSSLQPKTGVTPFSLVYPFVFENISGGIYYSSTYESIISLDTSKIDSIADELYSS